MKTGGNPRRAALANRLSVRRQSGAALQQTAHSIDLLGEVNPRKAIGQTPVSAARNTPQSADTGINPRVPPDLPSFPGTTAGRGCGSTLPAFP